MISHVYALPVGNALRLSIAPPQGATRWRVLRKDADVFIGEDDPTALVVHDGLELTVLDHQHLKNGAAAFYAPFYLIDGAWVAGPHASGTPQALFEDMAVDVIQLLCDRLEVGFANEIAASRIFATDGFLQVFNAPPPVDTVRFPCISVHLELDEPGERGIGDDILGGIGDDDEVIEGIGWLSQVNLNIVAWSLNGDERIEMRKALKRLLAGNRDVFDHEGVTLVNPSFRDEDLVSGEMGEPLYQVVCSLSCLAPSGAVVRSPRTFSTETIIGSINDVENPHRACEDCNF